MSADLLGRDDPTAPNYRQSVRVENLPEEFWEALHADMAKRAAALKRKADKKKPATG